ncbi:Dystrophin:-like isoforms A/C/F/G/H [Dinothrombium tinctorium]|uniref:Dystrophin:-like isoforms A/C/F/G/H n=1 Tax=Dinothrombium tinctorium TaxID=1965070 RepID=A0A3S3P587_9ACAR|nr:Dystrophin:-like isoforms A/C/F/G/H [Dinothrombium tinctorium]
MAPEYPPEEASRIRNVADRINQRFAELSVSIQTRGKTLQNALSSLPQLERALDRFTSWIVEAESNLGPLEMEADKFGERPLRNHSWLDQIRSKVANISKQTQVDLNEQICFRKMITFLPNDVLVRYE